MTERYAPPYASSPLSEESDAPPTPFAGDPETTPIPSASAPVSPLASEQTSDDQGTIDVAKEQASELTEGTVEAGQQVVEAAKEQASVVSAEAGRQAKDLLNQTRSQLVEQANDQQKRLASGLRELGEELHSMAQHSDNPGVAADLARQCGQTSNAIASWLEEREPGRLVQEMKTFARQRPGTFLLVALGTGVLAGRLTRAITESAREDGTETSDGQTRGSLAMPVAPQLSDGSDDVQDARPFVSTEDSPSGLPNAGGTQ